MNPDIASNLVAEEKSRGVHWRFFGSSRYAWQGVSETRSDLAMRDALLCAERVMSPDMIAFSDSTRCCGALVDLNHPDRVSRGFWFRIGFFFDRDGKEANVFVWSAPEGQFIRRSREWFEARLDNERFR